jgi:hypothetical protein
MIRTPDYNASWKIRDQPLYKRTSVYRWVFVSEDKNQAEYYVQKQLIKVASPLGIDFSEPYYLSVKGNADIIEATRDYINAKAPELVIAVVPNGMCI